MRVQVFSDLHSDVAPVRPIAIVPEAEAVIVAGDICQGVERAFGYLRRVVPMHVPIMMTLGNHEFYGRCWREEVQLAREQAHLYGIHVLENDTAVVGGVRFIGSTLWTDYALFGEHTVVHAMDVATRGLNDHRRITWMKQPWRRFRPQEALALHSRSRALIEAQLATPFAGPTVVVTHHAPHPKSIHASYRNDLLTAAFVSDLTTVIENGEPALWVHGHVHESFDYRVGATRVVCNPHGYGFENPAFDPAFLVELST
jgi:Icc-related predicted phosphoesterase